ncbi:MAG: hypothetical protein ABIP13_01885 [Tepidiformaceae bacterium]
MQNLRRKRLAGKIALQTPVISLQNSRDGRRATLVLTAHLGDESYFQELRTAIARTEAPVYFESVRSLDSSAEHWREPYHRFLKSLREDLYAGIAGLGLLAFQGDHLAPEPGWTNADVDCCTLATKLRAAKVPLLRYEMAFGLLRQLISRAQRGDQAALRSLEKAIKWGLFAVSFAPLFNLVRLMPRTRSFYHVISDWRSEEAVKVVDGAGGDFVLIYGAAHGELILQGLARVGFGETSRRWLTVFTA